MKKYSLAFFILGSLIMIAAGFYFYKNTKVSDTDQISRKDTGAPAAEKENENTHFSKFNSIFRFSADLPEGLEASYVPEIESVNISDKIFIRYFQANDFLTLSTVDILQREQTEINGHKAVRYEIKKKSGIANFPHQPEWRNAQHKLIDIRFTNLNPSLFYVFAHNPDFDEKEFEKFIDSLIFDNDKQSFVNPISEAEKRVTRKPFGLYVTPDNSPVSPEKFTGYHSAVDYEILPSEENKDVAVYAACGGAIREAKSAQGYGGVVVQDCELENQRVTVIYGHIKLSSFNKKTRDYLVPGEKVAILGDAYTSETGDERKHLHLGIRKGTGNDIRGYVQREEELQEWINFESL